MVPRTVGYLMEVSAASGGGASLPMSCPWQEISNRSREHSCHVEVQFLEIYLEQVKDLGK